MSYIRQKKDDTPLELVICVLCVATLLGMMLYCLAEVAGLLLTVVGCAVLLLVGCAVGSAWYIWTYEQVRDEYATIPEMPAYTATEMGGITP